MSDFERLTAKVWVNIGGGGSGLSMEAYFHYHTMWRGQPVAVTVEASRKSSFDTHSREDVLNPWWFRVTEAREGRFAHGGNDSVHGKSLTPTAKSRLREKLEADARHWIFETSDAVEAIRDAYYHMCVRELKSSQAYDFTRPNGDRLLERFRNDMGPDNAERFERFNGAWKAWVDAVEEVSND